MRLTMLLVIFLPALVAAEPLRVFVTVSPIQTFVEKIGGKQVDVRAMVRPGSDPHTYEPTPQQIAALTKARLYVSTGVPFERAWMDRIQSANSQMQLLDALGGIDLVKAQADEHADHDDHKDHAEHETDPHVWTSPLLVKHLIGVIRDKLSELDPLHSAEYALNHETFSEELDALDREIRALLAPLPNRKFMVFHPAWSYFASAYGLTQIPIERQGKQPGAQTLTALIEQAQAEQIRVVFVQPQFDSRLARRVAEEIDGDVIAVDPLAPDYVDNLREVAQQLARALGS